jgi:cytochrome c556
MMRFSVKMAVAALLAAGVTYLGSASAADDDVKDVKGCMAFQNKVRGDLNKMVKGKEPKWEDVQKETKNWLKVAESIGTFKPPKGDEKSWKEQTTKYLTNVKAVDSAAEKKDADGVSKGLATIQGSCAGCHSQHRPKK